MDKIKLYKIKINSLGFHRQYSSKFWLVNHNKYMKCAPEKVNTTLYLLVNETLIQIKLAVIETLSSAYQCNLQ